MSDGGKGSRPRPFSVSQEEYNKRWDAIFGRDGLDDKPNYKKDNGPVTEDQLKQIQESAKQKNCGFGTNATKI